MTGQLCSACGLVMVEDFFGDGLHPLCEPATALMLHRAYIGRQKGLAAGRVGSRRSVTANPRGAQVGLDIIRRAAHHNRVLSADLVREDFEAAGVKPTQRGGIWQAAAKAGVVAAMTTAPSGGESAHGKPLTQYRSLVYTQAGVAS